MTVTTTRIQDIQTTLLADLAAGTWTNYATQPETYGENNVKFAKNVWLELHGTEGEITYTFAGSPVLFDDTCSVEIHAPNRTDINKIYTDFINILEATSRNYVITSTQDIPLRNKYVKILNVRLLK